MVKISKSIGDYVSGFAFKSVEQQIHYLYEHYYVGQLENQSDTRQDLGVDWWTAEYLADELEKQIVKLNEICENLREYANSGERLPIEVWQDAFKSTKKSIQNPQSKSINDMVKDIRKKNTQRNKQR